MLHHFLLVCIIVLSIELVVLMVGAKGTRKCSNLPFSTFNIFTDVIALL